MRNWKLYLASFVAGCVMFAASVANAQKAVRLGRAGNGWMAGNSPDGETGAKVTPVDPTPEQAEKIEKLIAQLGAPTLRERDRAMSEITAFGAAAIKQVQAAQDDDDDEIGHRCVILLEVLYSGKAELFLAARRLGMTDKELEVKLAAPDPSELLATLEQNAGAGMAPIWARVLASLAPMPQRFPAALACRRAEGLDGYGAVLVRAACDPETRKNPQRAGGLMSLIAVLPPQNAADVVLALAALPGAENPGFQLAETDYALRTAENLRGVYTAQACLAAMTEENEKLLTFKDFKGERLVRAIALALTPSATEAQLNGSRLPPLASMNQFELDEYCSLCARSGLAGKLEQALATALGASFDERRVALIAHGLARCGEVSFKSFDSLPPVAKLAMVDAWWFSPPPAVTLQPFLLARLQAKEPLVRASCAALLGGYRAPSTAKALADCALAFADTAPGVLDALAPMGDLLPSAAPQALKTLIGMLDGADLRTRAPLIDTLLATQDPAASQALKARWKKQLPMNEISRAVRLFAREPQTAPGAWCASQYVVAAQGAANDSYYIRLNLQHSDLTLLRTLLGQDDATGFALLKALAKDTYAMGSSDALLALACGGQDAELAPEIAKLHAAGNDPRGEWLALFLALSATPAGEEFRTQALKQGTDKPDLPALATAVAAGRGGKITREAVLEAFAATPANLFGRANVNRLLNNGPLPEKVARGMATTLLFDGDAGSPYIDFGVAMMLRFSNLDVIEVLYAKQEAPTPRTPLQVAATALLGTQPASNAIIARVEPAKDGANFELREGARAWTGLTQAPYSNAVLRGQGMWRTFNLLRQSESGDVAALRELFDLYSLDALKRAPDGFASVIAGSRYRGNGNSPQGVAQAAYASPLLGDDPAIYAPLVEKLLGEKFSGEFASWWSSRRGLVEYDAAAKRLKLVELK